MVAMEDVTKLMRKGKADSVLYGLVLVIHNEILPTAFYCCAVLTKEIEAELDVTTVACTIILVGHQADSVMSEDLLQTHRETINSGVPDYH